MKNIMKFSVFFFCLFLFSCSSSTKTSEKTPERVYNSLSEYLRTLPGVRVNGGAENARVFITTGGHNSTTAGATPLFVVEGQQIGNTMRDVIQVINPNEIKRARVIKSGDATIRFGINGANGAIEFFMKK